MTTKSIDTFDPETMADLSDHVGAIMGSARLADFPNSVDPSAIYLRDTEGNAVRITLVENILTDGSKTYDAVFSFAPRGA